MLCWCNIIVCAIPVILFGLGGDWGLMVVALLNLNIHLWAYAKFRTLTQICGCPGTGCQPLGHPTPLEKREINFFAFVNVTTYAFAFALMLYGIIRGL